MKKRDLLAKIESDEKHIAQQREILQILQRANDKILHQRNSLQHRIEEALKVTTSKKVRAILEDEA